MAPGTWVILIALACSTGSARPPARTPTRGTLFRRPLEHRRPTRITHRTPSRRTNRTLTRRTLSHCPPEYRTPTRGTLFRVTRWRRIRSRRNLKRLALSLKVALRSRKPVSVAVNCEAEKTSIARFRDWSYKQCVAVHVGYGSV